MGRGSKALPFLSSSGNWLEVWEKTTKVVTSSKARIANDVVFLFIVISFQGLKPRSFKAIDGTSKLVP
jgi:hypothetical protein